MSAEFLTPKELAEVLYVTLNESSGHKDEVLARLDLPQDQHRIAFFDLLAIRIAAVVSSVAASSYEPKSDLIDDLKRLLKEGQEPDAWDYVWGGVKAFHDASKEHHENGPGWPVGMFFASHIGREEDLEIVMTGMTVFSTQYESVQNLLAENSTHA